MANDRLRLTVLTFSPELSLLLDDLDATLRAATKLHLRSGALLRRAQLDALPESALASLQKHLKPL
jgi:hypothetical protein